jgi:hypothetical protein
MNRKQALAALKAAGAGNDRKTWTRVYVENRVSMTVAQQMWSEGQAFGRFIQARDEPYRLAATQAGWRLEAPGCIRRYDDRGARYSVRDWQTACTESGLKI